MKKGHVTSDLENSYDEVPEDPIEGRALRAFEFRRFFVSFASIRTGFFSDEAGPSAHRWAWSTIWKVPENEADITCQQGYCAVIYPGFSHHSEIF